MQSEDTMLKQQLSFDEESPAEQAEQFDLEQSRFGGRHGGWNGRRGGRHGRW